MKTTNQIKPNSTTNLLGMIAPTIFVFVFTVTGWLRPEYNSFSMHISALSLGHWGWIQILNFIFLGISLFVFSFNLYKDFIQKKLSKAGPIILILSSICFLFSGPFVMDPAGTMPEHMSVHGLIHGILGGIVFILMPITCFVFYYSIRYHENRNFKTWTLIARIFITIALVIFTFISKIPFLNQQYINYIGLCQRMVLIPYLIWIATFANY